MKETKIKEFGESIYTFTAVSNLPVYMWVNPAKENVYMTLTVKYGARGTSFKVGKNKYEVPAGTAHYLEHIKFHTKDGDVTQRFFDLGLKANAFTNGKQTTYEVYGNENVYDGLELLLDFVYDNYFTKQIVEDERNIILEEANSVNDYPYELFEQKSRDNMYQNDIYKKPTIGYANDINNITIDDISLVHEYFYRPENMFLVVTGKFDPKKMQEEINRIEKDRVFKNIGTPEIILPKETNNITQKSYKVKDHKCKNRSGRIIYKMYKNVFSGMSDLEIRIALPILLTSNFGSASDFYDDLKQSNKVTYLSSYTYLDGDVVFIIFDFESDDPKEIKKLVIDKVNNMEFSEEWLNRLKRYYKGTFILDFDNIVSISNSITSSLLRYGVAYNDYLNVLDKKITLKAIEKVKNNLDLYNMTYGEIVVE